MPGGELRFPRDVINLPVVDWSAPRLGACLRAGRWSGQKNRRRLANGRYEGRSSTTTRSSYPRS